MLLAAGGLLELPASSATGPVTAPGVPHHLFVPVRALEGFGEASGRPCSGLGSAGETLGAQHKAVAKSACVRHGLPKHGKIATCAGAGKRRVPDPSASGKRLASHVTGTAFFLLSGKPPLNLARATFAS